LGEGAEDEAETAEECTAQEAEAGLEELGPGRHKALASHSSFGTFTIKSLVEVNQAN